MMRRFFEIIPGALAWLTLILMVFLSWLHPVFISIFIILFDIYWLLKTIYMSLHLRATFSEMRRVMKVDWLAKLKAFQAERPDAPHVKHLVILPMYNEPYEIVRESFESLLRVHYAKDDLVVVLSIEEKAGEAGRALGARIEKEYGHEFGKFLLTFHPLGLKGELPGKGSNEAWAALRAKEAILDPAKMDYKTVLVSVFDVDTHVFPEYFGRLTYVFLNAEHPLRSIYQPVPLFTNNIYEAPALARVVAFSTTFWQMMQQSRPERLTSFSSQAIPFQTLVDFGFWDKDIVSEDSRVFWQGYLRYHGDFRVEPLFYPVSMDANVGPTFWGTMKNLYKQQRRWGWGAENIPYMLEGFRRDPLIPAAKKRYWTFNVIEGFHSWATNALIIFALGWLPLFLGGKNFNYSLLSYNLPHITRFIVELATIGIASSAILSFLLLPPREEGHRPQDYAIYFLQWVLMPLTLIIFGAFPGLEAQTRLMVGGKWRLGFWVTPKSRFPKSEKAEII